MHSLIHTLARGSGALVTGLCGFICASAAARADSPRVVVVPFESVTGVSSKAVKPFEILVLAGVQKVSGFDLVPWEEARRAIEKTKRRELRSCEGDVKCLSEIGNLVSAAYVISGDLSELDTGAVCYLRVVRPSGATDPVSTTAVFGADKNQNQKEALAAAYRLLAADRYQGLLQVDVDIKAARIFVDGQWVGESPAQPIRLAVGTHALRVTHDQYRDFVRFVDIAFDEQVPLDVKLTAFPIITDEMRETAKKQGKPLPELPPVVETRPAPWYRKAWAAGAFGVVVAAATAIIVVSTVEGIAADRRAVVR
mgnify:CR=1 FL=1